jgi:CDP-6-deoxy-D-xylo-4-hexulose-3-dehydrase
VRNGLDRKAITEELETANIETRLVFGGNILRQPGFKHIEHRIHGMLAESDRIMRNTFFVGVYPGLTTQMLDYMIETITAVFARQTVLAGS